MFDSKTADVAYQQCSYCGNYHSYSSEMCRDIQQKANSTQPPLRKGLIPQKPSMIIPDYKDQLQQIINLLTDIRYNTDRLRAK